MQRLGDNLSHNPEVVRRFVAEAEVMRAIEGPGILKVHGVGKMPSGQPFIAFELADVGNLQDYIDECQGRLQNKMVGVVLGKTAQALGRAHDMNVAHRDIKPQNILLKSLNEVRSPEAPDHQVLIGDFGIARSLQEVTRQTTAVVGTPQFMAPEQFEQRADLRCDVFALGVLAYWLIAGRPRAMIRTCGWRSAG